MGGAWSDGSRRIDFLTESIYSDQTVASGGSQTGGMKPTDVVAGRYRRDRLLGRGGMGEVYAALDLRTDRRVAVKLMHGHRLDSADARARFEREARVGARIDSPHLVDVLDAGVDGDSGTPFLVMELLDGEDLEQRLARLGPRPAAEVVAHLGQVALALARMRAERVVHRDLKPSNLFLHERRGEPSRIKVLDLGIAKELTDTGGLSTGIAGTPVYMAPEQISGSAVSAATDLYALGLIAFTLLVGSPYWAKANDEEPIALAVKMKDGPRLPASTRARGLGAALPESFDAWFERATARRPERRFASAIAAVRALAEALAVDVPGWLPDEPEPSPALDAATTLDDLDATAVRSPSPTVTASPRAEGIARDAPAIAVDASPARTRRRWLAPSFSMLALGGVAIATWFAWPRAAASSSPLAQPGAVIACPILAVDGDVRESGWLGAAAASLACERARVILGGSPSRTLLPAELLDLPAQITDDFPIDPYGAPDARGKTSDAAQRRSDAYLDGKVTRLANGFRVEFALKAPDGREIARGVGEGVGLHAAVRAAMDPLVAANAIPTALVLDRAVADYSRAWNVATMLAYVDLTLALKNNAGALGAECERFARSHPGSDDREQFARYECAFTLGKELPAVTFGAAPTTPGAETARARIEHMVSQQPNPAAIARLKQLYRDETSPWGQSSLAATLSCLLKKVHDPAATDWAQRAVQRAPRNATGEWCAPWDQLATLSKNRHAVTRAIQAWEPWHPYLWLNEEGARAVEYARRGYVLSPFDTQVADVYASHLIRAGRLEEARSVALDVAGGGHSIHLLAKDLLLVRLAAGKARFGEALTLSSESMRVQTGDAGWALTQRLQLASWALALAVVIGREHEIADAAVAAFVTPEPPPVDGAHVEVQRWLATICMYASPAIASACFARLEVRLPSLSGAEFTSTTAYAEGARRYAAGDLRGAADTWRPLVGDHDYGSLAEAMVRAFAATGDHAIVDGIVVRSNDGVFNGASMVTVRAAQAALARGDRGEAARLAAVVIAAWSAADVKPPVLVELQAMTR